MGIKGKRRRERLRQEKEEQERQQARDVEVDSEGYEIDDDFDPSGGFMMPGEELPPGVGPALGSAEAQGMGLPRKMKRSEQYLMQDLDYLERVKEEHANRRQSHLGKQREVDAQGRAAAAEASLKEVEDLDELLKPQSKSRRNPGAIATGPKVSHPMLGLHSDLVQAMQAAGFGRLSAIQQRTIPLALQGNDLLGQAKTGSGKTLAFCVPVLHRTIPQIAVNKKLFVALMLAPTKELCVQTHKVLKDLTAELKQTTFNVDLITGGTKVLEERKRLMLSNIVVGTPGRVVDHVRHSTREWSFKTAQFLVLDEADRMLADGFAKDLDCVIRAVPPTRQTLLFSATNSKSVQELARLSLSKTPLFVGTSGDTPTHVDIGGPEPIIPPAPYMDFADDSDDDDDEVATNRRNKVAEDIPSTLRQFCALVPQDERLRALYLFVKRVSRSSKAMIFCSTVASAVFHCQMMGSVGFHDDVLMLHGHMKHRQRIATFEAFLKWDTGVLFCTDVAARGLDIPDVEWILQYDPPLDPTEYVHRIGRTARAGSVGNAAMFVLPEEGSFIPYLAKFGITMEKYPMPKQLPDIQMKLNHVLQLDSIVAKSAITAFRAYVGAYQSHILKDSFNVHNLDMDRLATSFALDEAPNVPLPKNTDAEKKQEYVKGKLKSLNRRKHAALKHYEEHKTKAQWSGEGKFVGIHRPQLGN